LGDFSEKIQITHVYPKIGHSDNVVNMLKKLKKNWASVNLSVAVYDYDFLKPKSVNGLMYLSADIFIVLRFHCKSTPFPLIFKKLTPNICASG
jgi:hypothetical protein